MAATDDTPRTRITWDYAPAPESPDHVRLRDTYGLFIGGEFVEPRDGRRVASVSPATEEPVAEVAFAGEADVAAAVEAARAAQPKWAKLPGRERAKYLFRVARLIQERARELAIVESMDGGKPIRESRDVDVPLAAAHFFYYAGWSDKLRYGVGGRKAKPYGVVGQIVPWNFPLLMAAWKLAPALACGNTAVLKPAETTPLTALLLAEIFQEAEVPAGVANIVTGDGVAGAALVRSEVDKVAFTGSTAVGKDIQAALAGRGVGLTLELGGKSANIVFEDAAIDQAVEGIVQGIFFNQGHVCCAGSRLLIQESVADEVTAKLWDRMRLLRVGDPLDKNTDVGAINSAEQLERIEALVAAGVQEGAVRRTVACELPERGWWFAPTIFTDVAPAHRIAVEEIFGPVVSVLTFRSQAEAIEKANNSAYGLAAGIWTDKGSKAFEVASALKAGRHLAEHLQQVRPDGRLRGLQGIGLRPRGRSLRPASLPARVMSRLGVRKTYKLYVGGAFVRSESGRYDRALGGDDEHVANVPRASRKDVRDAMSAARKAAGPWAARTAYNRGQILYRAAEALESRADAIGRARRDRRRGRRARPLRGLDRQAARRPGRRQPGRHALPVLLAARADRRGRRGGARRAAAARPRRRDRARAGGRQHGGRGHLRALAAAGARLRRGPRVSPTCPAAWSTCSAAAARSSRRRSARTATSTRSSTPPATTSWPPSSIASRPRRSSARATARPPRATRPPPTTPSRASRP